MQAIEIDVEVMNADASDAIEILCRVCRRLMGFDCWLQTFLTRNRLVLLRRIE